MNKSEADLLSICLITYNHENFVEKALESILMQETNFDWKLVIADDCSKDQTRLIILRYKEKFPDKIQLIFQEKNVGPAQNWLDLITAPKSKYIAYMEGDDYWTDSLKLQKQVDFLEQNEEYVLCFHDANYLYPNQTSKRFSEKYFFLNSKFDYTRKDLFKYKWFIPSASIVFRNQTMISKYLTDVYSGDSTLYLFLSQYGKFRYMSDCMSIYRITGDGVGSIINKPQYRIGDLKKWMSIIEPYEKKFIYRQLFGNYKLLLISNIKNKKMGQIFQTIKNIVISLFSYVYCSLTYYFYKKKSTF